jgi:hypothetical protein
MVPCINGFGIHGDVTIAVDAEHYSGELCCCGRSSNRVELQQVNHPLQSSHRTTLAKLASPMPDEVRRHQVFTRRNGTRCIALPSLVAPIQLLLLAPVITASDLPLKYYRGPVGRVSTGKTFYKDLQWRPGDQL